MINTQKIIKYVAISLALLLTINIISGIMHGIISLGTIVTLNDFENNILNNEQEENQNNTKNESEKENSTNNTQNDKVNNNQTEEQKKEETKRNINLEIDINSTNIYIKKGTSIKVETNNKYINIVENNNKISITEEKHSWLNQDNDDVIIYVPSKYYFDSVYIENGAGNIEIETLNSKNLSLDLGAGKVNINNLKVSNNAEIDGGVGGIIINEGSINNLDLDMGVGKVTIKSKLTGSTEINAGIGALHLNLIGTPEDYKIIINKGIGTATLNNEKIKNDIYYGNGSNLIDIDGGMGTIKIETKKN